VSKISTKLLELDNFTLDEAIKEIISLSQTNGTDYVITPNIDHLVRLVESNGSDGLQKIYNNAALNLCDSRVLEKLLKLKGLHVNEVIPGSTLTKKIFDGVLNKESKVLIIGADFNVLDDLREKYNEFNIQHYNPPMGFIDNTGEVEITLEVIKKSTANFIFLAIGSPRQEILAGLIKDRNLIDGVVLCIGASILFLTGAEKRAPYLIQKMHLEWAYRMLQDPKRLVKRYYYNFIRLPSLYSRL
jgi:exopolysaccharide biosynthesis WecB/TagA/CpsF family protein